MGEHIQADPGNPQDCETIVVETVGRYVRPDILINNAAMMMQNPIEKTSLDDWNSNLAINLTAPILLIKHALPTSGNRPVLLLILFP